MKALIKKLIDNTIQVVLMFRQNNSNMKALQVPVAKIAIGGIVIVVAALSYMMLNGSSINTINSATTLSITKSASAFRMGDYTYGIALAKAVPSSNVAYIYLNRLPAFMNPLLNVTVYTGQGTRINAGTSFANIELQAASVGSNSVALTITPISTNLQIAPDSAYISTVRTSLQSLQQNGTASGSPTSNTANTAANAITTTSVLSTSTTTVTAGNVTRSEIMAALQKSIYYPLMVNYSSIYANTLGCTPVMYNATYTMIKGSAPAGFNTFQNVSQYVPYSLYSNITSNGAGVYSVIYRTRTISTQYNNSAALTIRINASAGIIVGSGVFSGVFMGLNHTQVSNGYTSIAGIKSACAAYMS